MRREKMPASRLTTRTGAEGCRPPNPALKVILAVAPRKNEKARMSP